MGKSWLVAVDGSNNAEWALHSAVDMLEKGKDKLHILSVAPVSPLKLMLGWEHESDKHKTEGIHKKIVEKYLEIVKHLGITNVVGHVVSGYHVGEIICQYISDNDIDVVVLGSKGLGGLAQRVFGSTTRHVFETSACDCIVVKNEHCPGEIHASKGAVIRAEEKERKRRMGDKKEAAERYKMATNLSDKISSVVIGKEPKHEAGEKEKEKVVEKAPMAGEKAPVTGEKVAEKEPVAGQKGVTELKPDPVRINE